MRAVRWLVWAAALASGAAGAAGAGSGLVVPGVMSDVQSHGDAWAWPSLRGRFSFGLGTPGGTDMPAAAASTLVGARLLGDYYFSRPAAADGRVSGFRATGGLLIGPRLGAWAGPATALGAATVSIERRHFGLMPGTLDAAGRDGAPTVPYVGVGYSDAFGSKGRWGLSADLGLMALRPSSGVRLGRDLGAGQTFDDTLRDLRLAPMLQLGVSYSF